ncbi:MAG: endonuclease/exonuclease/phosphatase family protein [Planctomycetes bacterium]|nr:endonuclease/exonuclease/phosphatase family protein [Planctomycetota bacterium]
MTHTRWSVVFLLASVPLAWIFLNRRSADVPVARFASFNVALNRAEPGALLAELRGGGSEQARRIAEIVQRHEVDVLLLCELDRDTAGAAAEVFAHDYLAVGQNGQRGIDFEYRFVPEVNTGEPSGLDLDDDGKVGGPGDAHGFGTFPGQYATVLLSRHPILQDGVRTFRTLPWSAMPGALRPPGVFTDAEWRAVRLSSKTHADVPIGIGEQGKGGRLVHVLLSHPTPPVFDGPEDRNGCRNHDEIRFWVDYLTPGSGDWIVDDRGEAGGLAAGEHFVVMGDLNCDPVDGDARREALIRLLGHDRVFDPKPRSSGGEGWAQRQFGANSGQRGDPALDTGDFDDTPGKGPGNLRVDYVLPSRSLQVVRSGVFWPGPLLADAKPYEASDHRLVFVDIAVR